MNSFEYLKQLEAVDATFPSEDKMENALGVQEVVEQPRASQVYGPRMAQADRSVQESIERLEQLVTHATEASLKRCSEPWNKVFLFSLSMQGIGGVAIKLTGHVWNLDPMSRKGVSQGISHLLVLFKLIGCWIAKPGYFDAF